jgi:hypothetical protein
MSVPHIPSTSYDGLCAEKPRAHGRSSHTLDCTTLHLNLEAGLEPEKYAMKILKTHALGDDVFGFSWPLDGNTDIRKLRFHNLSR